MFCKRNGITCLFSLPYNGAAENVVKSFKSSLKKLFDGPLNRNLNLETFINCLLFFYRPSIHCSTQETPYEYTLVFGREMVTHIYH